MRIVCNPEVKTPTIFQAVYAQKTLESIGIQDAATPMAENPNLVANPKTADKDEGKEVVHLQIYSVVGQSAYIAS